MTWPMSEASYRIQHDGRLRAHDAERVARLTDCRAMILCAVALIFVCLVLTEATRTAVQL